MEELHGVDSECVVADYVWFENEAMKAGVSAVEAHQQGLDVITQYQVGTEVAPDGAVTRIFQCPRGCVVAILKTCMMQNCVDSDNPMLTLSLAVAETQKPEDPSVVIPMHLL